MVDRTTPSAPCRDNGRKVITMNNSRCLAASLLFALCSSVTAHAFEVTSPVFEDGGQLPQVYACSKQGGQDMSWEIDIRDVPAGAVSLVVIMDDPDAQPDAQPGGANVGPLERQQFARRHEVASLEKEGEGNRKTRQQQFSFERLSRHVPAQRGAQIRSGGIRPERRVQETTRQGDPGKDSRKNSKT